MRAMTAHWQQTLIPLTGIGLKLLSELLVAHPYPVSRSNLISAIWGADPPESNALKSHIYSLRKVLEHVSGRQLLFTISNVGYQLKGLIKMKTNSIRAKLFISFGVLVVIISFVYMRLSYLAITTSEAVTASVLLETDPPEMITTVYSGSRLASVQLNVFTP